MRSSLTLWALALAVAGLSACEGEDLYIGEEEGDRPRTPVGRDASMGGGGGPTDFTSVAGIEGYLDGKLLVMSGDDIPTDPNGFNENVNFGQATQCYNRVEITVLGTSWTTRSVLAPVNDAPEPGSVGVCDRDTVSLPLEFNSTAIVLSNVQGDGECFDVNATYPGFGQEGRGRISADGTTVELEFYFKDQAVGHRCADGDVGAPTVTLNNAPFMGDAIQVYRVMEAP